ncbi:hypothetical protein M9H77_02694 [Catharanthus roseus]|uniref:Uncharacterized protein n=1 Tax=Catharanthus roseus TaxID=4058 RepID=A0ACC0C963_CATRO|nr:hypothetical protein M9H77_02694 [Catharanthus roseus]
MAANRVFQREQAGLTMSSLADLQPLSNDLRRDIIRSKELEKIQLETTEPTGDGARIILDRERLTSILGIQDEGDNVTVDSNKKTIDEDPAWSFDGKEKCPQGRRKSSHLPHLITAATPRTKRRKFGSLRPRRIGCESVTMPPDDEESEDNESYNLFGEDEPPLPPWQPSRTRCRLPSRSSVSLKTSIGLSWQRLWTHQRASIDRQEVMLAHLSKKFIPGEGNSGGGRADFVLLLLISLVFYGVNCLRLVFAEESKTKNRGKQLETERKRQKTTQNNDHKRAYHR